MVEKTRQTSAPLFHFPTELVSDSSTLTFAHIYQSQIVSNKKKIEWEKEMLPKYE